MAPGGAGVSNTPVFDKLMAMPGGHERYMELPPRNHSAWFRTVANKVRDSEEEGGDGVEVLWRITMSIGDEKNASMASILTEAPPDETPRRTSQGPRGAA